MRKQLMLLAAGVLSALALTALPSAASAGEPMFHCVALPCTYTVEHTGSSVFSTADGDTISCTSFTGSGGQTALSSTTGSMQLLFHGCKEQNTIFKFACSSPGQPSGTVTTNSMVTHNVQLNAAKTTQGIMLTGANTTFSCAGGFSNTRVTGNVLGHIENPNCNVSTSHYTIQFEASSHGQQKFKQVTGAGPIQDLISDKGEDGSYTTAAQTGTCHIKMNQNVRLTC